jgi:hypothetical protein
MPQGMGEIREGVKNEDEANSRETSVPEIEKREGGKFFKENS